MRILKLVLFICVPAMLHAQTYRFQDTTLFHAGNRMGALKDLRIGEVSGMAASLNNPGYFWVHNDSGNPAEVYLLDDSLTILFTIKLPLKNRDWEDMTVGPGPDPKKSYIYIADIGDNFGIFPTKFIHRFEEPTISKSSKKEMAVSNINTIRFQLSDTLVRDMETMFIDPRNKNLYLVSKRDEPAVVYEITYPYSVKDTLKVNPLTTIPYTQIVAGGFSADGKELLLKNYRRIFYWSNASNKSVAELLKEEPKMLPYHEEPQGEALTWKKDGSGYYTLTEFKPKRKCFLFFYPRK